MQAWAFVNTGSGYGLMMGSTHSLAWPKLITHQFDIQDFISSNQDH